MSIRAEPSQLRLQGFVARLPETRTAIMFVESYWSLSKESKMADIENSRRPQDETHDPEFEMPDPEQVDRDIEEAEKAYGSSQKDKGKKQGGEAA